MSGFAWDDIDVFFEVAFGYTAQDDNPVWMDVTDYGEEFDSKRGQRTLLGRWTPGQLTVLLDNSSGRFDPNNTEDGPEIINNPGFETGSLDPHAVHTSGGVVYTVVDNPAAARTGDHYLEIDCTAQTSFSKINFNGLEHLPALHQTAVRGQVFYGSCHVRSESASNANRVKLLWDFWNSTVGWMGGAGDSGFITPNSAYQLIEVTSIPAPVDAEWAVLTIFVEDTGNPEPIIRCDDVSSFELWPEVKIGVPARLRAVHNSVEYLILQGTIPEWPLEYATDSEYAYVPVTVVESRGLSLGSDITLSRPLERSDQRIEAVLDAVGWPAALRALDVGDALVAAADLAGVKASDHIDQVVLAEVGHFFIAADGKATFLARTANAGGPASQATFGVGNIEYDALIPTYNDEEVYNDVRITRTGGVQQVAADAAAQTDLGYVITFEKEAAVFYTDHGALNTADWMLGRHKDARVRVRTLEWKPQFEGAAGWPAALGLDLRATVTVQFSPPGGGTQLDQVVAIQGIRHRARGGGEWVTTFDLAPLSAIEIDDYWILGTSALGIDARLA